MSVFEIYFPFDLLGKNTYITKKIIHKFIKPFLLTFIYILLIESCCHLSNEFSLYIYNTWLGNYQRPITKLCPQFKFCHLPLQLVLLLLLVVCCGCC